MKKFKNNKQENSDLEDLTLFVLQQDIKSFLHRLKLTFFKIKNKTIFKKKKILFQDHLNSYKEANKLLINTQLKINNRKVARLKKEF